jgi:hypothetical protein
MRPNTPKHSKISVRNFITMINEFSREFPRDLLFVILINALLGVAR